MTRLELREKWINEYKKLGHAGKVCDRFGISRFTLRKWIIRYNQFGLAGLSDFSHKPINSPLKKRTEEDEALILDIRKKRKLGARRIQNELKRLHNISFSLSTIHKILKQNDVPNLVQKRHYRKQAKRYNCQIAGERIQMDVCKITKGVYQFTAIDDCTRYRVLAIYNNRSSNSTLKFLKRLISKIPFPIQRIQTDRGQEFFAYEVQDYLRSKKIKFRPIRPASPYLNGKVERSQRTDLDEFYSQIDPNRSDVHKLLEEWEDYYNTKRVHSSLGGLTPLEKLEQVKTLIPNLEKIATLYDASREQILPQNYKVQKLIKYLS